MDPAIEALSAHSGGFNFENCKRNAWLEETGKVKKLSFQKTGTTICGMIFKDGVVMGADTRATAGSVVAVKNCSKLHVIQPNMIMAGAGTAADCDAVERQVRSQLDLMRLNTDTEARVSTAVTRLADHLFRYQGHVGAYLILGGVDVTGPHLVEIYANGAVETSPFMSLGSGSLAAISMLEAGYKEDMDQKEAEALVTRAISAGIMNDMGSGSNVDLAILKHGVPTEYKRGKVHNLAIGHRKRAPKEYKFPHGSTRIIKEVREVFKTRIEVVDKSSMEIDG